MKTYFVVSLFVMSLLFSLLVMFGDKWISAIIKPANFIAYLAVFFGLLWLSFLWFSNLFSHLTLTSQLSIGAVIGFIVSFIAQFIIGIFTYPDGLERIINSVNIHGIKPFFIIYSVRAMLVGGWFFGLILVPVIKHINQWVMCKVG